MVIVNQNITLHSITLNFTSMGNRFLTALCLCMTFAMGYAQAPSSPPTNINIDKFYTKYMQYRGIEIVSSDKTPDSCMTQVYNQVEAITDLVDDEVVEALAKNKVRVAVAGRYEGITEFPDYGIKTPSSDIIIRGVGGKVGLPTFCAEENVLAYQIDPNFAEDIFVKSFGLTLFEQGVFAVHPDAKIALNRLYNDAKTSGRFEGTYAMTSAEEYLAEGVQDWFDVNCEAPLPNGEHNWVNTRADLKKYDKGLYDFIGKYIAIPQRHISKHPLVNLYKKDDKKAYAKLHEEKKLNIDVPNCVVEKVGKELAEKLNLDTKFYKKHVNSNGIHILSSDRVPDSCLAQAHKTVYCMTAMLPQEVLDAMTRVHTRVVVMAKDEVTIDVPEHNSLKHDKKINWNLRARGLGGTLEEPITSCAEENVMAYAWDKYHAEDILIHEFSHSIHLIGILQVDPTINGQLKDLLNQAKAEGKWHDTYGGTVFEEYWAEGVQNWFNVNAETPYPDGKHNQMNTREEMKKYDPRLYALISKYFPETNAQIGKHRKENKYKIK